MFLYFYLVSPSSDNISNRAWIENDYAIVIISLLSFVVLIAIVCICVCCLFLTTNKRKDNKENKSVPLTSFTHNKFGGSKTETISQPRSPTLTLSPNRNSKYIAV